MSTAAMPTPVPKPRTIPDDVPDGYELVNGKLRRLPMAAMSSWGANEINRLLTEHCRPKRFGVVYGADTAYSCFPTKPAQVRKPDVSVIAGDPTTYVPPMAGI